MKTLMKGLYAAFVVALIAAFAAPSASAQSCVAGTWNYTGNWAEQPQKTGMGLVIIHQGCRLQMQFFVYDSIQNPTWLNVAGGLTKDTQQRDYFEGPLQLLHGTPPTGYTTAALRLNDVGSATITFTGQYSAVMTYRYPDPAGGSIQEGTLNLVPAQFGCEAPAMWNNRFCVAPQGTKVAGPKRLPAGCMWPEDAACKQAVRDGTVKFVETSAKMTGYSDRPMMFGYFITSGGEYVIQPFYADTGEPFTANAFNSGVPQVMDWVQGTPNGALQHYVSDGCFELRWFPSAGQPGHVPGNSNVWGNDQVSCP